MHADFNAQLRYLYMTYPNLQQLIAKCHLISTPPFHVPSSLFFFCYSTLLPFLPTLSSMVDYCSTKFGYKVELDRFIGYHRIILSALNPVHSKVIRWAKFSLKWSSAERENSLESCSSG
ncbi:hypothetical protein LINGRAHAP2_LOCUS16276 [Linum grandiflorum]